MGFDKCRADYFAAATGTLWFCLKEKGHDGAHVTAESTASRCPTCDGWTWRDAEAQFGAT